MGATEPCRGCTDDQSRNRRGFCFASAGGRASWPAGQAAAESSSRPLAWRSTTPGISQPCPRTRASTISKINHEIERTEAFWGKKRRNEWGIVGEEGKIEPELGSQRASAVASAQFASPSGLPGERRGRDLGRICNGRPCRRLPRTGRRAGSISTPHRRWTRRGGRLSPSLSGSTCSCTASHRRLPSHPRPRASTACRQAPP